MQVMANMSVTVKLSPLVRKFVPDYDHDKGIVLKDGAGKKVNQIIEELAIPKEMVTMVMVNHRPSNFGYSAREGDLVLLAMVIGGG
jgi:hypothetical protein